MERVDQCSQVALFSSSLLRLEVRQAHALQHLSLSCPKLVHFWLDGAALRGGGCVLCFFLIAERQSVCVCVCVFSCLCCALLHFVRCRQFPCKSLSGPS